MTNWDRLKEIMDIEEIREYTNPFCDAVHKLRQEEMCKITCADCKEWLKKEYKPQILTDKEREYLSAVIKPFRDKIKYIMKEENSEEEWVSITMEAWTKQRNEDYLIEDYLIFPSFQTGTMYKGMDTARFYTLEELGL